MRTLAVVPTGSLHGYPSSQAGHTKKTAWGRLMSVENKEWRCVEAFGNLLKQPYAWLLLSA